MQAHRTRSSIVHTCAIALLACGLGDALAARQAGDGVVVSLAPDIELAPAGSHPAVATTPQGNTLVAWIADGLITRRLRSSGDLEPPFRVRATNRALGELRAGASDTSFVLAWREIDDAGTEVFTERVRGNGRAAGGPRPFASPLIDSTLALGVAPDGRHAVLFTDARPLGSQVATVLVRLQRFVADGRRNGAIVRLSGGAVAIPPETRVASGVAAGPDFVAAGWTVFTDCDAEGSPNVQASVANLTWDGVRAQPAATFRDGRACDGGPVLTALLPSDIGALAVLSGHNHNLQRFDAETGAPRGPRTVFAEMPQPACEGGVCTSLAAVAGDRRGRFVAVWEIQDGDEHALAVQLRGREGRKQSDLVLITHTSSLRPTRPAAAMSDNGVVHVVWEHADDDVAPASIHLRTVDFD